MSTSDEFPLIEEEHSSDEHTPEENTAQPAEKPQKANFSRVIWGQLMEFGLAEPVLRVGMHLGAIVLVLATVWAMRNFYLTAQLSGAETPPDAALAAPASGQVAAISADQEGAGGDDPDLPALIAESGLFAAGIPRLAELHTLIPSRPRVQVITYTVQSGDTVFGIAESYGLRPETIFWGNQETLGDNPHNLRAGQALNILPTDGTYHKWSVGESFVRVADFYGVDPQAIVEWPGNPLDAYTFNAASPEIDPGTWLIVPGGERQFIDWGPPRITRDNPAVASTYGPGHCGTVTAGAVGSGVFVWPTTEKHLSGYDYSPASNHWGIDIAGSTGNAIYAADSGVVVYSGWSNYGYGYLIVIDHGAWQSLYAHLSAINVFCGQSVFQGSAIGGLGSTGNSSGPHLHFELMYGTAKVNPWNYLTP